MSDSEKPEPTADDLPGTVVYNPPKKQRKLKPARKQVKPGQVVKEEPIQTGKEYNIWYNKWAGGDREDSYSNKVHSQTRCNIRKDSGLTRADTTGMKYTCLFFSRGCCPYGWECEYRHALPDPEQDMPDTSKDCFARNKFADYRDDMGGVGSFNRQNRTLYVGRIKETGVGPETEEIVIRHFREWGDIERVRVLQYRSVAFVTYHHEVHAQFAKEAMSCQSLDNEEILNVRWATDDPNPTAKVVEKRRIEEVGRAAIAEKMDPRILEAMRAVRALEDGVELGDIEDGTEDVEEDDEEGDPHAPPAKRQRLEVGAPPPPPQSTGLLSADTLEGLKYFAEIRQRNGGGKPPPPQSVQASLEEYGSDDE